jgi:hypothetical protein
MSCRPDCPCLISQRIASVRNSVLDIGKKRTMVSGVRGSGGGEPRRLLGKLANLAGLKTGLPRRGRRVCRLERAKPAANRDQHVSRKNASLCILTRTGVPQRPCWQATPRGSSPRHGSTAAPHAPLPAPAAPAAVGIGWYTACLLPEPTPAALCKALGHVAQQHLQAR